MLNKYHEYMSDWRTPKKLPRGTMVSSRKCKTFISKFAKKYHTIIQIEKTFPDYRDVHIILDARMSPKGIQK